MVTAKWDDSFEEKRQELVELCELHPGWRHNRSYVIKLALPSPFTHHGFESGRGARGEHYLKVGRVEDLTGRG